MRQFCALLNSTQTNELFEKSQSLLNKNIGAGGPAGSSCPINSVGRVTGS